MKTDSLAAIHQTIEELPDSLRSLWFDDDFKVNLSARSIKNIVIAGSSEAILGARIIIESSLEQISKPCQIVNNFSLPAFVGPDSLVIIIANHATSEASLALEHQAVGSGAIVIFASCDPLFSPKSSPKSHRVSLPVSPALINYQIGLLAIFILRQLVSAAAITFEESELPSLVKALGEVIDSCADDVSTSSNPAATVAGSITKSSVVIFASDHLLPAAESFSETLSIGAGQSAFISPLSSFTNLKFPPKITALFILSADYAADSKLALDSLANHLEKLNVKVVEYIVGGGSPLSQSLETLQFANFVTYFLARKNKINKT